MANNVDTWVQIFDILDTNKHKKGFTIYKVISMLYPKDCPDSVTKVTAWKRYNDFKKFHREMKHYVKLLKLKGFPSLPKISYFHRFDEEVIQQRRTSILLFLEYIALNRLLYTSDICVKFFKTSHAPCDILDSNIQLIRSELNLPETEYNIVRSASDDDHTLSDTDSLSTLSSFQIIDHLPDPVNHNTNVPKPAKLSALKNSHKSVDAFNISNISLEPSIIEEPVYPTPPHTPNSSCVDGFSNYIHEASLCIEKAIDFEICKKYEEAFNQYKAGIDILLKNVKDDKNTDIKDMIRHKIEKYLLRAEKIYTLYLSTESQTVRNYVESSNKVCNENVVNQAESDLYNYKVLRVIGSGMLVLHTRSQKLFYVKVIHKSSKFSNDRLKFPGNVPYMVKLYNYYNCENALFLILEYISGINLHEYINKLNADDIINCSFTSTTSYSNRVLQDVDEESSGSEHSYSDLIYDYALHRSKNTASGSTFKNSNAEFSNEKLQDEMQDCQLKEELSEEPTNDDFTTASTNQELAFKPSINVDIDGHTSNARPVLSRKSSERSEWSWFDDSQLIEGIFLSTSDVTKWAAQLLIALERLHSLGIVCGDLQMKNLLIDDSGDLMLTYMYNIQEKNDIFFINNNEVVLAPEMRGFQPVTFSADWWSYGAILYEMLVGMPLGAIYPDGFNAYSSLRIPKHVSLEGRSLLRQLLVYEPQDRLGSGVNGSEDIKTHPFFNTVLWDLLLEKYKNV